MFDLIITDAKLLDTASWKIYEHQNVAVNGERIAKIFSQTSELPETRKILNAEGKFLFPGFIDFHVHVFQHGSTFGMDANLLPSSGVTCAVDMGSAGWINFPAMFHCDIAEKKISLKTFINISPIGQPGKGINEPLKENLLSVEEIRHRIEEYPGMIKGLKVRISKGIVKELGITPLKAAVKMGEELGLPVCVHTTDPPVETSEVIKILRPGDIYSHTYHGKGSTILDDKGNLQKEILEAQKNGVIIEVGNGKMNFNFPVAEKATNQGLWPNIISSDATPATFHKEKAMWDISLVMSKFLNLGMPLREVIRSVTETPAKILNLNDRIGFIKEGYNADFSLCSFDENEFEFCDSDGNNRKGKRGITPELTILSGQIIYKTNSEILYKI